MDCRPWYIHEIKITDHAQDGSTIKVVMATIGPENSPISRKSFEIHVDTCNWKYYQKHTCQKVHCTLTFLNHMLPEKDSSQSLVPIYFMLHINVCLTNVIITLHHLYAILCTCTCSNEKWKHYNAEYSMTFSEGSTYTVQYLSAA